MSGKNLTSTTEVHAFCDIPNYLYSIQDTSYGDSIEVTFCLHINKLFFRLLSWLGKNDTKILNSSDTSQVGCHCWVPLLFQNETPFVVGFLHILASKMTQKRASIPFLQLCIPTAALSNVPLSSHISLVSHTSHNLSSKPLSLSSATPPHSNHLSPDMVL